MTPRLSLLPLFLLCLTVRAGSAHASAPPVRAASSPANASSAIRRLPSEERVRAAVKDVLSRREFRKRGPSLMERLADWADRWLDRLGFRFPPMKLGGFKFNVLQFLVALVAMIGFLFLIGFFIRWRIKSVSPEILRSADPLDPALSLDQLLQEADALALAGDYRAALERAYVGTLMDLSRNRLLNFAPHRTNWENLLSLDSAFPEPSARTLRRISRLFDRKWYGLEAIGADEYERAARDLSDARRLAQSLRPDPASIATDSLARSAAGDQSAANDNRSLSGRG